MGRLEQKVCVVTGAAGGIGAATAELFCAQGACVMLVDMDSAVQKAVSLATSGAAA